LPPVFYDLYFLPPQFYFLSNLVHVVYEKTEMVPPSNFLSKTNVQPRNPTSVGVHARHLSPWHTSVLIYFTGWQHCFWWFLFFIFKNYLISNILICFVCMWRYCGWKTKFGNDSTPRINSIWSIGLVMIFSKIIISTKYIYIFISKVFKSDISIFLYC
jgi:hypothetical protein